MTDKEKKTLKDGVISIFDKFNLHDHTAIIGGLRNDILKFINSMQEEPVSKDLEKITYQGEEYIRCYHDELDEFANRYQKTVPPPEKRYAKYSDVDMVIAVKAGAKWQKEQMMKDAVDACVTDIRTYKEENEVDFTVMYEKGIIPYEIEQEVKVIVIKEE